MAYKHKYEKYKHKNQHQLKLTDTNSPPALKFGHKNTRSMILPHAGSKYVKDTLDYAFANISNTFTSIILLTTNHYDTKNYQYNLPLLSPRLNHNPDFFNLEHSHISVLPYLTQFNAPIFIISIGTYDKQICNDLIPHTHVPDTLLIANTDLLHCGPNYDTTCPSSPKQHNLNTIRAIINNESLRQNDLCGKPTIQTFNHIIKNKYFYTEYTYMSSDNIESNPSPSPSSSFTSVGYTSILYNDTGIPSITTSTQLLKIPPLILKKYINWNKPNLNDTITSYSHDFPLLLFIKDITGLFVTIYNNTTIKGCIGTFNIPSSHDIISTIVKQTFESAIYDSRSDLTQWTPNLTFKINFLKQKFSVSESELYTKFIPNVHGIILTFSDGRSATYLASVMPEHFNVTNSNFHEIYPIILKSLQLKAQSPPTSTVTNIELYECIEI